MRAALNAVAAMTGILPLQNVLFVTIQEFY